MLALAPQIQQVIVLVVTVLLIVFLLLDKIKPSYLFFSAVLLFLLSGIIRTNDLLDAFANESILSIFLLIFITAAIKEHFNLIGWMDKLFGNAKTPRAFLLRMTSGVAAVSAFLNNTPIVALFMPYVYQWSKKRGVSPSKLLMPLSFAAILGGMITVIGTSTNLVLNGLIESKQAPAPTYLDYLIPGVLVSIGGILFLYFIGYKWLPDRTDLLQSAGGGSREYLVEVKVVPESSIIGRSIAKAGLRNLNGIYLFEVIRNKQRLTPVKPEEVIQAGDILVFAGDTDNIIELLERHKDFTTPFTNGERNHLKQLNILETVIPYNSELVGQTLKRISFRENYDAAVVAIHRNGERLHGKIGEIALQAGDLLLVSPGAHFRKHIEQHPDLYLISVLRQPSNARPSAVKGFAVLLLALIAGMSLGWLNLFFSLLLLTAYMIGFKLLSIGEVKKQLDVDLLVILVSSLTFSTALIDSGAAKLLAEGFMSLFHSFGNMGIIVGVYLLTLVLTSFVTHVAAVSIVFPVAYAIALQTPGMNAVAIFIAIAFAASASFHSPFSYQTNMMVYGPGGYKFKDFLKVGFPITLIYSVITLSFIAIYYKM
ncbi:MAG TPA: SLC13 family permease [Edaphocola sp.]|nr:SLC13 family permease [Edaphocola sp.]